jgi:hypothetical protein
MYMYVQVHLCKCSLTWVREFVITIWQIFLWTYLNKNILKFLLSFLSSRFFNIDEYDIKAVYILKVNKQT